MIILTYILFISGISLICTLLYKRLSNSKTAQLNRWLNESSQNKFNIITYMQDKMNIKDMKDINFFVFSPVNVNHVHKQDEICISSIEKTIRLYECKPKNKYRHLTDLLLKVDKCVHPACSICFSVTNIYSEGYDLTLYLDSINFIFRDRSVFLFD